MTSKGSEKGDWLSEIKANWETRFIDSEMDEIHFNRMFSDIHKGHEAAIQEALLKGWNYHVKPMTDKIKQLKSDLEAARKEIERLKK